MKKIIFFSLIPFVLCGAMYDSALLQIGAKLFPKVALMEKGTKDRIQTTVNLVIVTDTSHKVASEQLSDMIERQYGKSIVNYTINLTIASPKEALEIKNAHGFILLMEPEDGMLPLLLEHAQKNKILTFSFDPSLLQKGAAVSLYVGRSVKPYINLTTLKEVPFTFEYGFLKLSQPY